MRILLFAALATAAAVAVALPRTKRQAYHLPDGAELIVGNIVTSFRCQGDGYYADIDNDCKIFHVCTKVTHADGYTEMLQHSFFCGNLTVFNQLSFTCAHEDDAVPCQNAADFFYLNGNLGDENALFLNDDDVQRAADIITGGHRGDQARPPPPVAPPAPEPQPVPPPPSRPIPQRTPPRGPPRGPPPTQARPPPPRRPQFGARLG
ncbi:uncharacterized protein LOC135399336 [Ornithodoros turicata]|uniref:Putative cuticular protein n=1 Tax=Ornithodoros turicata TaxID=34597 RepID=A0A2R5LLB7_9ACAR